jgi:transposase-like protein
MKVGIRMSREYTPEFKAAILDELFNKGRSRVKVAEEYGVPIKTIENWVTAYNKKKISIDVTKLSDKERIKVLEESLKKYKKENLILKKTISYLAKTE